MNNPQQLEALLILTARFIVNEATGQQRRSEAFLELQRALDSLSAAPAASAAKPESDAELFRRLNAGLRIENSDLKGHIAVLEKRLEEANSAVSARYPYTEAIINDNVQKTKEVKALKEKMQGAIDLLSGARRLY